MRFVLLALLLFTTSLLSYAQNVGIGINPPLARLHVNGAWASVPGTVAAAAAPAVPTNVSHLSIAAVVGVQANALTAPASATEGQLLTIYNEDGDAATFAAVTIPATNGVGQFIFLNGAWRAMGTFPNSGAGWLTTGNAGTTPGTNYLGTTDNVAMHIHVNGQRAFRLEPGTVPNVVGGSQFNFNNAGIVGGTIAGGGNNIAGSTFNAIYDNYGTVGGGQGNTAGDNFGTIADATHATVGGGIDNSARGEASAIGGGSENSAVGDFSTIAGGITNATAQVGSTVGGGEGNAALDVHTTVGGGYVNFANADFATVAGGAFNQATANYATVAGGDENEAAGDRSFAGGGDENNAIGALSVVVGGDNNTANGLSAFLGGGSSNSVAGTGGVVVGGQNNTAAAQWSSVGGGVDNSATGLGANIGGGSELAASGAFSTIGGGVTNVAAGNSSTIAGGEGLQVYSTHGTIGGGQSNTIFSTTAGYATISGGQFNSVVYTGGPPGYGPAPGLYSTIAGGLMNEVSADYAAIGGGEGLHTQSAWQHAVGRYNLLTGGNPTTWVPTDVLFSIGNGTSNLARSNAVTVLKNGNTGIGVATPVVKLEVAGVVRAQNYLFNLPVANMANAGVWNTAPLAANEPNLVDDNLTTGSAAVAGTLFGYYTFDLGAEQKGILYARFSLANSAGAGATNVRVEISADGTNFFQHHQVQYNPFGAAPVNFTLSIPVWTRYFRLGFQKAAATSTDVNLQEVYLRAHD